MQKDAVPTRFKDKNLSTKRKLQDMSVETTSSTPKKICFDPDYRIKDLPRKLKREFNKVNLKNQIMIASLRKRLKTTQRRCQRYKLKIIRLKNLVQHLKKNDYINSSSENILNQSLSGVPLALMKRVISGKKPGKHNGKGRKYSNELTAFALTLQFYSTKAYEYVRKTFNLSLPSQSLIRKLYSTIPAGPGFTGPAFVELNNKVEESEIPLFFSHF